VSAHCNPLPWQSKGGRVEGMVRPLASGRETDMVLQLKRLCWSISKPYDVKIKARTPSMLLLPSAHLLPLPHIQDTTSQSLRHTICLPTCTCCVLYLEGYPPNPGSTHTLCLPLPSAYVCVRTHTHTHTHTHTQIKYQFSWGMKDSRGNNMEPGSWRRW
jgi:hypothetical protein